MLVLNRSYATTVSAEIQRSAIIRKGHETHMVTRTHLSRLKTQDYTVDPAGPHFVYLLHFPNGAHYIGATSVGTDTRLKRHLSGRGSRYVHRLSLRWGPPIVALAIPYPSRRAAFTAERQFKRRSYQLKARCPLCHPELR